MAKFLIAALLVVACGGEKPELRIPHRQRPRETEVPVMVAGDVRAPSVSYRVTPDVSRCARPYSGVAIATLWIRSDGSVERASMARPITPCIDRAVVDAMRQWKFFPATKNNVPLAVIFNATVQIDIK